MLSHMLEKPKIQMPPRSPTDKTCQPYFTKVQFGLNKQNIDKLTPSVGARHLNGNLTTNSYHPTNKQSEILKGREIVKGHKKNPKFTSKKHRIYRTNVTAYNNIQKL